ncbi:MAG: hypothetical protein DRO11_06945 [Methanobacteriota archaeon]|nr:MAG: hypothetical protein DRO11_06945 [Euryarchaeota archaeon]
MRVEPECASCILGRAVYAARVAGASVEEVFEIIKKTSQLLASRFGPEEVPARIGTYRDRIVKAVTKNPDPFREMKLLSNEAALSVSKGMVENLGVCSDKLVFMIRMAVAANSIEFGVESHRFGMENLGRLRSELLDILHRPLGLDHTEKIREKLLSSKSVLYLCDNAGEIVFDYFLIDEIKRGFGCQVTAVVRGGPVINDATMEDAEKVGLTSLVRTITTGSDAVGVLPEESPNLLQEMEKADLVIAKGMGNYETITEYVDMVKPVVFLLMAKCSPVARSVGVGRGDTIALLVE